MSKFEAKFGGSWNCVSWADGTGEADLIAMEDCKMRLKVRGQIFEISEARDSLVLPISLDKD